MAQKDKKNAKINTRQMLARKNRKISTRQYL